jgi:hypothetical protein
MQFHGALIREQGQVFGVISVQPHVLDNPREADRLIATASSSIFPGHPVALMALRFGRHHFYGRPDISRFLASIDVSRIPWRRWTIH